MAFCKESHFEIFMGVLSWLISERVWNIPFRLVYSQLKKAASDIQKLFTDIKNCIPFLRSVKNDISDIINDVANIEETIKK